MQQLAAAINSFNEKIGRLVSWLTLVLIIVVCGDVIIRRLFESSKVWVMEIETFLFALIFLFGAAYAFQQERHVRVDVFYAKMSEKDKALVNLVGGILFLIPWCLLLLYTSSIFTYSSFLDGENSANPGGLPYRWVVKAALPIGFFLLLLQGIAKVIEAWFVYKEKKLDEIDDETRHAATSKSPRDI